MYDPAGKMVFEQTEIENAVLHHFSKIFQGQNHPVFPLLTPDPQHHVELTIHEIDQIMGQNLPTFYPCHFQTHVCTPYSYAELTEALTKLPSGKSSGYDGIPNETLKNTGFSFRLYLQTFLNRILETVVVPQALNLGKCILISKVCIKINYHHFETDHIFSGR